MRKQQSAWRLTPLAIATVVLGSANVCAQSMEDFVISPENARRTLNRAEISVETAERVAKLCVEWARERDLRASIIILGPSGNIVYAYRMDGLNPVNVDTAILKAESVLYMRTTTQNMVDRYGMNMRGTFYHLEQFPHAGGLPIMVGDQLIGAIGIGGAGGGRADEDCAHEAMTTVIGPQPPLPPEE